MNQTTRTKANSHSPEQQLMLQMKSMAVRYLSYRPGATSGQVRRYLMQKSEREDLIIRVVNHLCRRGFIDDAEAAQSIISGRCRTRAESHQALYHRLLRLGIEPTVAKIAIQTHAEDERTLAIDYLKYKQANLVQSIQLLQNENLMDRATTLEIEKRKAKIFRSAKQRGFSYTTIQEALHDVLHED